MNNSSRGDSCTKSENCVPGSKPPALKSENCKHINTGAPYRRPGTIHLTLLSQACHVAFGTRLKPQKAVSCFLCSLLVTLLSTGYTDFAY